MQSLIIFMEEAKMPRAHESYNVALGQLSLRQKTGGRPGGHGARGLWQHRASPFQ